MKIYKFLQIFFIFSFSIYGSEILNIDFNKEGVFTGKIIDKVGPYFSIGEIKGKDIEVVKIEGKEVIKFEREKSIYCIFTKDEELNVDYSNGFEIEIVFLYNSTSSLPEKVRGGVHTLFSKYDIKDNKRTFSIHLNEFAEKANIEVGLSTDGKGVFSVATAPELESGKIYIAKIIFIPKKHIQIFVNNQLRRKVETNIESLFKSDAPISVGCRFYADSPINFFNGVIFSLKFSIPEKEKTVKESKLPNFVNWSLDGAYTRENGIRGEVILNGWWTWTPVKEGEVVPPILDLYLWRKVPGIGKFFHIKDSQGNHISNYKGVEKAWIEREFSIPNHWRERDVFIEIGNTKDGSEVFLDGEKIGVTMPELPTFFEISKPYKENYKLTVLTSGITDNVWLKSYPSENRIVDIFVIPSFRKKSIEVRGRIKKADNLDFSIHFYSYENPTKEEKSFSAKIEDENFKLVFLWEDARLWSYENPQLYWFDCEIRKNGKIIDKTFLTRFGFREFWIEDGDFYLNGKKLRLKSDSNVPFTMYSIGDFNRMGILGSEEYIQNVIIARKNLGLNSCHVFVGEFLNPDVLLKVCDEIGYYVQFHLPTFSSYAQFFDDIEIKKYIEECLGSFISRIRQSPSVLFYFVSSGSHVWDYCPTKLDGSYNPDKIWGENEEYKRLKKLIEIYDDTRPISYYSGGARDPIHTTMGYINFDSDLQVHENWPLFWSKKRPRPLFNVEFGLPYLQVWFLRPKRGYGPAQQPIFLEWASLYFGERPFLETLKKKEEYKDATKVPGQPKIKEGIADELRALFAKNIIRAWRTYGISFAFHAEVRNFFKNLGYPKLSNFDPRVPYYISDAHLVEGDPFPDSQLNLAGIEVKKALSPFLVYIGGPDNRFTLKDHCYFSYQKIRKCAILVNDREIEIKGIGKWEVIDLEKNTTIYVKNFTFSLLPGEINTTDYLFEFKPPEVKERKEYLIKLNVKAGEYDLIDTFQISVFPKQPLPLLKSKIYLYDPIGDTKSILHKAGIKAEEVYGRIPEEGIFIIGRKVLEKEEYFKNLVSWQTSKLFYGIDPAISEGLKVLIFEQPLKNVLGLTAEERRWRRAHITAPKHKVFKGLKEGDFYYLKGDSDLTIDFPDPGPPPKIGYAHPERFWMFGNDNVVTTFPLIKPQKGAYRALLSSGFDLMETPLVEFAIGKGRIIFCQVDVTNRYGDDPISTILVNNILEYLDKVEEPDPSLSEPIYIKGTGIENVKISELEDYIFQPVEMLDGLTISDFYFREILKLNTIETPQGKLLFTKIKNKEKEIFYHTLNLQDFKTRWQRMKAMRILANLKINQGGSSNEGPSFILHGDDNALYPINWLEGFVHPYLYWRW